MRSDDSRKFRMNNESLTRYLGYSVRIALFWNSKVYLSGFAKILLATATSTIVFYFPYLLLTKRKINIRWSQVPRNWDYRNLGFKYKFISRHF